MKHAIVLTFSLVWAGFLSAHCEPIAQATGSQTFWKVFTDRYGAAPFPAELQVCTGNHYFFEIKGGAKMQSALDRKKGRIVRRNKKLTALMHEMAHVYLDLRWRILPYPVAEPFVLAMSDPSACPKPHAMDKALIARWRGRQNLTRCELLDLLKDVLTADAQVRDALPLQ